MTDDGGTVTVCSPLPPSRPGLTLRPFGDLEAAIMRCLWGLDRAATVREVHEILPTSRKLAYTTVMTVMDNLHRKGQLQREMIGRAYSYTPVRTRAEHSAALLQEVLDDAGDKREALMHFVADLDPASRAQLRQAVEPRRRGRKQP